MRFRQYAFPTQFANDAPPIDTGKKVQLSDLEKQARKEENARRRKLQMDQKMENDRVCLDLTAMTCADGVSSARTT